MPVNEFPQAPSSGEAAAAQGVVVTPGQGHLELPGILARAAAAAALPEGSPELRILGRLLLHHQPATAREYARDIRAFAAWCAERGLGLLQVERTAVEVWLQALAAQGLQARTIRRRLAALQGFYLEALDMGLIERVPTLRVRRPRVREAAKSGLSREEASRLLEVAEGEEPRDEVLVRLLLLNGLRASEAAQLRVGDLGQERGHRTLTVHRKGGTTSVEAVSPATSHALDRLLAARAEAAPEDWLLTDREGGQLSRHSVARVTRRLGRLAGCAEALNPHELRHAFITLGLDAGATLRDLQRAAAHADPRTTAAYDRRRKALDTHPSYLVERYL